MVLGPEGVVLHAKAQEVYYETNGAGRDRLALAAAAAASAAVRPSAGLACCCCWGARVGCCFRRAAAFGIGLLLLLLLLLGVLLAGAVDGRNEVLNTLGVKHLHELALVQSTLHGFCRQHNTASTALALSAPRLNNP
jgi:hypothetical protein